jgi:hypothetical protein
MKKIITLLICLCFFSSLAFSQTGTSKESCKRIENVVRSAIYSFGDIKKKFLRTYDEEALWVFGKYTEYVSGFQWPGTSVNLIRQFTSDDFMKNAGINMNSIGFVSSYPMTDTKEKAYTHLKKFYSGLIPCVITPLPGQKAWLNGALPPLSKAMDLQEVMDTFFIDGQNKRHIRISLGIHLKDKKYCAQMKVELSLGDNNFLAPDPQCDALNQIAKQLATNFSGQYGELTDSKINPPIAGFSTETNYYKANKTFPGSDGTEIVNEKAIMDGKLRRESWEMSAWYGSFSYKQAVDEYKKLYYKLQGCTITSPKGRQTKLEAKYEEPGKDGGDVISFNTSTESESFFISIKLEKQDDKYFVFLSVSLAKMY